MSRTAIVLFNLGGPDSLDAVRPFLLNLFSDPAIIRVPQPLRFLIARLIAARRTPVAREIYRHLSGRSPILEETEAQARALEAALGTRGELRAFIAMRYWHPMSDETARAVAAYAPERVVLLPLYPQFSTTTTASSLRAWRKAARRAGLDRPSVALCCYPGADGFIEALASAIRPALAEAQAHGEPRLLLSAHGLPKKIVAAGDPYQQQVEETARRIVERLDIEGLDWQVCYQSRVGPLEWIGPATDDEVRRAGADRRSVVLAPIAFVSEHSETLVELDIEYRRLAERSGVAHYARVPAVGTDERFIEALAALVRGALDQMPARGLCLLAERGGRLHPATFKGRAMEER
ncbi:MAG: ferrochelatase [Alphaproteobacteria bacterium]